MKDVIKDVHRNLSRRRDISFYDHTINLHVLEFHAKYHKDIEKKTKGDIYIFVDTGCHVLKLTSKRVFILIIIV